MKFAARILSGFFLTAFFFLLVTAKANAQTLPLNTDSNVPNNLHTYTQNIMLEVASSLTCMISGIDPVNPSQQCLGVDTKSHKIGFVQNGGGAIGVMGNLIAATFNPPVHTRDFARYLGSNFGIAKGAYADTGIGFTQLSPLLEIWKAFRNITYLLFVLVFVVIGFAIMLRVHIDPRTVMTIENQIPKIIIGLILVTFSFAIAGFLVDLMYVFMYLVFGVFSSIGGSSLSSFNPTNLQGHNAIEIGNALTPGTSPFATGAQGFLGQGGFLGIATTITSSLTGIIFNFFGIGGIAGGIFDSTILNGFIHTISGVIGFFTGVQVAQATNFTVFGFSIPVGPVAGVGIGAATTAATELFFRNLLPNLLIFLVISLSMLFALFRLWFTLIKAYVFLLIDIIFAPFWVIAGLIPGSNLSFTNWLRSIGSDIIAFPATLVMFLLGKVLIDAFSKAQPGSFFVPPFIGDPGSPNLMASIIGFGIILLTPSVVDMMKAAFKAPKFDLSGIGQSIGFGTGALTGAPGSVAGYGGLLFSLSHIRGLKGIVGRLGYDVSSTAATGTVSPRGGGGGGHGP